MTRTLSVFEARGCKILRSQVESDESTRTFRADLVFETDLDGPELYDLAGKLIGLGEIQSVEFSPRAGRTFSEFLYPVTLSGKGRALVFSASALASIASDLQKTLGSKEANEIMFSSGKSFAIETARTIEGAAISSGMFAKEMNVLRRISETVKATGWGICSYTFLGRGLEFQILDSPPELLEEKLLLSFVAGFLEELVQSRVDPRLNYRGQRREESTSGVIFSFEYSREVKREARSASS